MMQSLEKPDCGAPLCKLSGGGRVEELLLNISEESSVKEQEPYEILNQTGWDEAIQGWGRCSPFSCLFIAQQRSKKHKQEISASHCVLCTDLKDLKLSDLNPPPSRAPYEKSVEHLRINVPLSPEHLNRIPSAVTSTSSSEDDMLEDFTLKTRNVKKGLLGNKWLFGTEQYVPDRILPHPHQPDALCPCMKDRNAGKVSLLSRVMFLPPVKVPTNPKSSNGLKGRDDGTTRTVMVSEKCDGDPEEGAAVSNYSPTAGTTQGIITSMQGPTQYQNHLLSALNVSRKYQIPINSLAETQPGATQSLPERNLRQEELIRSPVRHNSALRSLLAAKNKILRKEEPELPMLLGTKVQIPVSTQRLL
ncbi:uncharacterized protein C16orf46 [Clarias gariepinus]|uniref:uncharacterized protein C16orf46 n=1 Tax=Clarias gariepinus TaxID=13013 RepID=UPI00234CB445|nr:uncharacterized protein C16orf46 [Clarias gariepinus]XP_053356514.1 uncharacterized protein C16orf46 [Clarias gariepinus]